MQSPCLKGQNPYAYATINDEKRRRKGGAHGQAVRPKRGATGGSGGVALCEFRQRAAVYATGNKWAIENYEATHS